MAKKLGAHKEVEALAKKARKAGWTVEVTGGNHLKFTPPPGAKNRSGDSAKAQFTGLTNAGPGRKKFESQLRREGLDI